MVLQENPINIAYTGEALSPHMDLIYYESPPGLQLLHCLRLVRLSSYQPSLTMLNSARKLSDHFFKNRNDDSVIGGESLLLDSYPIVEELRNNYPEQFHSLTTIPATFQKIHYNRLVIIRMMVDHTHVHTETCPYILSVECRTLYWENTKR